MATLILAVGLVLSIEGLVFALAPSRLEDLIKIIADTPIETRRAYGLAAIALGVLLVWGANAI